MQLGLVLALGALIAAFNPGAADSLLTETAAPSPAGSGAPRDQHVRHQAPVAEGVIEAVAMSKGDSLLVRLDASLRSLP